MTRPTYNLTNSGWAIAAAIAVLTFVGLACIYVTDTHYAAGNDGPANAAKQSLRVVAGLAVASIVLRIGYQSVGRYAYAIFLAAILLLVPLLVAKILHTSMGGLTAPRNGAYRWIQLPGFPFQPSEFVKLAYVIALAWYLRFPPNPKPQRGVLARRWRSGFGKNYRRFGRLLIPLVVSTVPMALILLEPDLGTAMLLVPVLYAMLFIAGARIRHLALVGVIGLALIPLAWGRLAAYQRLRISAVLMQNDSLRRAVIDHPEKYRALATKRQALEWAAGSGYQLVHSKNAIGSGGVLGQGWGRGVYVENNLLPDRHNDFVFAVVAHQWGLVGGAIVMACYVVIVVAGVRIASATPEPFARLLAVGVVALMGSQAIISVAMTVGLLPITGMTLPFVSYGGSSLLFNFAAVALLVSVAQHRPYLLTTEPFVFQREQHERIGGGSGDPATKAGAGSPPSVRIPAPQTV